MNPLVTYRREQDLSFIVIDDGHMNLMSTQMLASFNGALDQAQADKTTVVISGRPKVFSAGFDLAVFNQGKAAQIEMLTAGALLSERLLGFPAPVIAACTGHAIAMGAFILLSADLRIGQAMGGGKISVNEVQIGLTVPRFALTVCRARLTTPHLSRAPLTAHSYSPEAAVDAGFLDVLVRDSEWSRSVADHAFTLSRLNRSALLATKLRLRDTLLKELRSAIESDIADWKDRPESR